MSSSPRQQPDQKQKAKQSQGTQAEASRDAAVDSQASTRARSHAGASADRQTQVQQILSGFQGQIKPVRPSARYLVGIGIVAFVMLLLALLYLTAVISLGAALLVGLLRMIIGLQTGGLGGVTFSLLLLGWLLGLMFVLFLIKPLFAPSVEQGSAMTLRRSQEPELFEFIERICDALNAPRPSKVIVDCEVNAAASLGGLLGLFGGRSFLLLGLPLAAGMNTQQLAGVIAHEFGHLSQHSAMRFSSLINAITVWFARSAYERDQWDYWLARAATSLPRILAWPLRLVMACIAGARFVLAGFHIVGHFVSVNLTRQMEFNADLYEARLSGSRTFAGTTWRLHLLGQATGGAVADLQNSWKEKRLSDNYPALIAANVAQVSERSRQEMAEYLRSTESSLWDTHPSPRDRVERVREEDAPGIYAVRQPAAALFADFDRLCRRATLGFYRSVLGPEINQSNLIPVAKLVKSSRRQQANRVATARFFQGLLFPHRPVIVTAKEVAPVPDEQVETAKETLFRVRTALARGLKETERAYERYFEFDDVKVRALRALALLDAGLRINAESFGVDGDSRDEVIATLRRAIQSQNELGAQLERFESLQKKRLVTALSLVKTRGVAEKVLNAFQYGDTIARVTKMGAALKQAMPALLELRNDFHGFHSLVVQDIDWKKYPPLVEQMVTKLTCACDHLRTIEYRLCDQEYPFDHARGRISLSKYLFEDSPGADKDDLKATAITAGEVLSRMSEFYFRQMEELAGIATEVEISLGHKPLPVPKKLADEPGFESSDF